MARNTQAKTSNADAVMGAEVEYELTPSAIEAIQKLEAHYKAIQVTRPMQGYMGPMQNGGRLRGGHGQPMFSDNYLACIAQTRREHFPVQPLTIYVKGEALVKTSSYEMVAATSQVAFTIGGKRHLFSFIVESDEYQDLTEFSGMLLAPVPTGVVEFIEVEKATAKTSGEETLGFYLTTEREPLKVGDRVRQMLDNDRTFVVVEKLTQDRYAPNQSPDEPFKDLIVVEVTVNYSPEFGAIPALNGQPFKVYSGTYMLAGQAK